VSSSENRPSRFLKELGIKPKSSEQEMEFAQILFEKNKKVLRDPKEIIEPYSFKGIELSASRLKTFLTCKRKYYYSYVKHINDHQIPQDMPPEYAIGNDVHKALENLYTKRAFYSDARELQRDLEKELDGVQGRSELEAYLIALKKKELQAFYKNEIERFNDGWHVAYVEKGDLKVPFEGMTLQGKIDRIDKKEHRISVLDYKTGSYTLYNKNNFTEATDFQLEFYYLLAGGLGNVEQCAFYDLKEGRIIEELFLEEKLSLLKAHIHDLLLIEEINFELCEDTKNCLYCPYKIMCGRG
jgi:RecB family exonuclease